MLYVFLGYKFVSQTDTEIIAKMIKYMYDLHPKSSFSELVEMTVNELEGKVFPKMNRGKVEILYPDCSHNTCE